MAAVPPSHAAAVVACVLWMLVPRVCLAQTPTGTVTGVVRDPSGAVLAAASVQAEHRATGRVRSTTTSAQGEYTLAALLPDEYQISVDVSGFQRVTRTATVQAGTNTRADFVLRVGDIGDLVTVPSVSPQLHYDSAAVASVILRDQIEGVPLNGRSFLELAKLEPGLQPATTTNRNRTIVPVLGAPASNVGGARFTIDGGSVTSIGLGGSQMGFSQEVVQEFQVSTVNFDLATGMTDAGAINVVTRAGGNTTQGSAFYFFRDHHLAAYPALGRDRSNPDPFFQRQQFGFALGGPILSDRLFYFGNWERNDQQAIAATTLLVPDFAHLTRLTRSPLLGDVVSLRLDAKLTDAHSVFGRFSRDSSDAFGPAASISGGAPNAYPSNWNRVAGQADQSLIALTSVVGSRLINELRVSSFGLASTLGAPNENDCDGCLGAGAPSITVFQAGLVLGHSTEIDHRARRFQVTNAVTWHQAAHRVRFGIDWEHHRERSRMWNNDPVTITLFSPDRVRAFNAQPTTPAALRIALPLAFDTIEDILQLPVQSITVGIGEPGVLQEDGADVRRWNTFWLYAQDSWRVHDRATVSYGLGWGVDGLGNRDLHKPMLLAPILGAANLGPTQKNWTNFSPAVGITWTPDSNKKTVVRGGAGRFYRPQGLTSSLDAERVALHPPGLGRQNLPGSAIVNAVPGIPGLPFGAPIDFRTQPTRFTGAALIALLPSIRAALGESAGGDPTLTQIEISKQASPAIFPVHVPNPSAVHLHLGMQRELPWRLVLGADVVYRRFSNAPQGGGSIDLNHFNSVRGAAIPRCTTVADAADPLVPCSRGAINVQQAAYRFTYKGLLIRAERRVSNRVNILGSYAYSRNAGTNMGNGFDLDDPLGNVGPAATDVTHIANFAGTFRLPAAIDLGFNVSWASAAPFSAYVGGIDFNGDGTTGDLLPGTSVNSFNRGARRGDLERLVSTFNQVYAGSKDAQGTVIPQVALPPAYDFGDGFHSLDLRVSRALKIRGRLRVVVIGEVFNAFNASNLSGYSGDLTTAAFGQPTARVTQVFGSGGPRSFQFAAKLSF